MNLFDNAEWLKIPELEKLDNELLNYIDYIYNQFPNIRFTDVEWIDFISKKQCLKNMPMKDDIINFKYQFAYDRYSELGKGMILYIFMKCDLDHINKVITKLPLYQVYLFLKDIIYIYTIFMNRNIVQYFKYLYSFLNSSHKLYYHYIQMRIFLPVYSKIIPYLLSKYSNRLLYNDPNIYLFLTDFYDKQYNKGIYTYNDINIDLYNIIIQEYMENMRVYAYNLYDYCINQFIIKPNYKLLNILLNCNIKPINNESSLRIIKFLKQEQYEITDELVKHILSSCILNIDQINELYSYKLLSNI